LAEAVEEQKAIMAGKEKPPPRLPPPTVDLPLDAFIPASYVSDVDTRLELYRALGSPDAADKLDDIMKEFSDRFGNPPPEVLNLLYAVKIKGLGTRARIESITTEEDYIILRRFTGLPFDAQKFVRSLADGVTIGHTQIRIEYKKLNGEWKKVLEGLIKGLT
jgi:transcription-repair coupling factor (superfamily II helicase)